MATAMPLKLPAPGSSFTCCDEDTRAPFQTNVLPGETAMKLSLDFPKGIGILLDR
jgi:hypothetical protein